MFKFIDSSNNFAIFVSASLRIGANKQGGTKHLLVAPRWVDTRPNPGRALFFAVVNILTAPAGILWRSRRRNRRSRRRKRRGFEFRSRGSRVRAHVNQDSLGAGFIGGGDVHGCFGVGFPVAARAPTAALVILWVRPGT